MSCVARSSSSISILLRSGNRWGRCRLLGALALAYLATGCSGRTSEPEPLPPPVRVHPPLERSADRQAAARAEVRERRRAREQQRAEEAERQAAAARADAAAVERQVAQRRSQANNLESKLRQHYEEWQGVRYRYGGMSKTGIDCSGFVALAFRTKLGIDLPRTTAGQVNEGTSISKRQLQAGDLVFFKPERNRRHVGIYLSDGEFMHSSTSRGVMISDLERPYWKARFWQARRVKLRRH